MRGVDVIVVGGGPAGSAAAHRLKAAGADVLVLDRSAFPRHKLCAGWITPEVLRDVELDTSSYPHGFLSFRRLHWHLKGLRLPIPCVQHSIRRFEFDAWLLERSGAEVVQHAVKQISRDGEHYLIDGSFRCRYLIGAAERPARCAGHLFATGAQRDRALQTVTLELEFPYEWRDPDCHLWFFEQGLPGYSWYVPKARGWLNVGVGAMAARLKERGEDIWAHWRHLACKMQRQFDIALPSDPTGYSYYVRGAADRMCDGRAFLTGDSAGLATRDLCEGIGPAIRSGQLAADCIIGGNAYDLQDVSSASLGGGLISRSLDWGFNRGGSRTH